MYKKINITENSLQIISLFAKGFDKEYYIREVQKLLKISSRTAQIILMDLENKTILESKIKGKIKIYKIMKNDTSKNYLVFAEQYKKISFLKQHNLVKEVISRINPFIKGIALIFGSYAKGIEKKDSDLDIFIAGEYNKKEIKKISKLFNLNINVKNYSLNDFKKNIKKDILIKEVLDNHIVFLGHENFVEEVLKNE